MLRGKAALFANQICLPCQRSPSSTAEGSLARSAEAESQAHFSVPACRIGFISFLHGPQRRTAFDGPCKGAAKRRSCDAEALVRSFPRIISVWCVRPKMAIDECTLKWQLSGGSGHLPMHWFCPWDMLSEASQSKAPSIPLEGYLRSRLPNWGLSAKRRRVSPEPASFHIPFTDPSISATPTRRHNAELGSPRVPALRGAPGVRGGHRGGCRVAGHLYRHKGPPLHHPLPGNVLRVEELTCLHQPGRSDHMWVG